MALHSRTVAADFRSWGDEVEGTQSQKEKQSNKVESDASSAFDWVVYLIVHSKVENREKIGEGELPVMSTSGSD